VVLRWTVKNCPISAICSSTWIMGGFSAPYLYKCGWIEKYI
jgi:hypothetical protein